MDEERVLYEERILHAGHRLGQRLRQLKVLSDYVAMAAKDPDMDTSWADEHWQHWMQRHHAQQSIVAVSEFLYAVPEWRGLDVALDHLERSLLDIENGRKPKWLWDVRPVDEDGNRPLGAGKVELRIVYERAQCAAVMEILMKEGNYSREKAATYVMRHLPEDMKRRLLGKYEGREVNWRTYARWREDMSRTSPGWRIFELWTITTIESPYRPKAEDLAQTILSMLVRMP